MEDHDDVPWWFATSEIDENVSTEKNIRVIEVKVGQMPPTLEEFAQELASHLKCLEASVKVKFTVVPYRYDSNTMALRELLLVPQ